MNNKTSKLKQIRKTKSLKINRFSKTNFAIFAIIFATIGGYFIYSSFAAATMYYVSITGNDANPGTQAQPWRTIQKASNTILAGDTVMVSPGNYAERVTTARSGTSTTRITFKATAPGVIVRSFTVNHNFITVDGLEFTGAGGTSVDWNGSNGELINSDLHETGAGRGGNVVSIDGTNNLVKGNHYHSTTGPGDDLSVITLSGTNNLAESNEIGPGVDNDAFRAFGHDNTFRGNYIHDITLSSGSLAHLDVIQTFGVNGGESYNMVLEKNIINNTNGDHMQMFMTENNTDPDFRDWDMRDNIFIGLAGQANLGILNIRFYNNTVYNSGAGNNLIMFLYDTAGKGDFSGAQIKNNIFAVPSSITTYRQVMNVGTSGSNVQISNNLITRIGTWGTVSGFDTNSNSINGGNPMFTNAGSLDFHLLTGSPAINRGLTLSGFNYDYDNVIRPQGASWDLGAFEFVSGGPSDTTPPTVSVTAPANGASVSGAGVALSANASDNVAVAGVQFRLDGNNLGSEDMTSPYSMTWDSRTVTNGSHTITAVARDTSGNMTTSSTITFTTNNATSCLSSSSVWQNSSFSAQSGTFTFDFDATPSANNIDTVTGLSSGAASSYSSLGVIVRFNTSGNIDAVNDTGQSTGGNYTSVSSIPYSGGTSYHFKLTVNTAAHTYSATVTPSGGSVLTLATNYGFRFEQRNVASLNNWAMYSLSGTESVCGATINQAGGTAKVGDINNDNSVNITDLSLLLSSYGQNTTQCITNTVLKCDLSSPGDGVVNIFDLSILLSKYGT